MLVIDTLSATDQIHTRHNIAFVTIHLYLKYIGKINFSKILAMYLLVIYQYFAKLHMCLCVCVCVCVCVFVCLFPSTVKTSHD